ncbi:hypothetical protein [Devosia sp.]|uniref:hypothetical protein n=1 Tax=Devosia sp. TaxID=1871048 RepID=UPI003A952214
MTYDSPDPHGDGSMGSKPSQAIFVGWMGIGLMAFMAVFTLFILIAAGTSGFS